MASVNLGDNDDILQMQQLSRICWLVVHCLGHHPAEGAEQRVNAAILQSSISPSDPVLSVV